MFLHHCFPLTVCSCHVTYAFQSESTLYSCLNVKELLAQSRHEIWRISDCNWTQTHGHLVWLNDLKDHPYQHENNQKLCGAKEYHHLCLRKDNRNWDSNMIRIYQWERYCRTTARVSKNQPIQKCRTVRLTLTYPSRKVSHLSKIVWEREITAEFKRLISFTTISYPVFIMDIQISKDKYISR